MTKIFKVVLALLMSAAVLTGCSSAPATDTTTATATEEATAATTGECTVKIGLVTDTGGVDDKSFNQSAWEGLSKWASENNATDCVQYLQSTSDADYIPNLSQFGDDGYDLVIAVGYLFDDAIAEVTANYPDTKFLQIDSAAVTSDNLMTAVYSAEQGSYLVGIAAGMTAVENGSNKVGFIGGMEGDLIGAFQAGYEQGVLSVCPECKIYVDYADSFSDDAKGQQLAIKQYDDGVTVIFQAAGNAGNGAIKEAKERGDVWVIGVDKDQYEDGMTDGGTSVILTSMIKRVDVSSYTAADAVAKGTFTAGTMTFDLTNDGVGAETSADRNLSADIITAIENGAASIKDGSVKVEAKPEIANGSTN